MSGGGPHVQAAATPEPGETRLVTSCVLTGTFQRSRKQKGFSRWWDMSCFVPKPQAAPGEGGCLFPDGSPPYTRTGHLWGLWSPSPGKPEKQQGAAVLRTRTPGRRALSGAVPASRPPAREQLDTQTCCIPSASLGGAKARWPTDWPSQSQLCTCWPALPLTQDPSMRAALLSASC